MLGNKIQKYHVHSFKIQQWGNEAVIYVPMSGDTHLTDAFSAKLLHELSGQYLTEKEFEDYWLSKDADFLADKLGTYRQLFLDSFLKTGLIELEQN